MADVAAFAADLHLDDCAWVRKPDLAGDAYCSLNQLVTHCVTHRLPLLLGGDLFDKTRPGAKAIYVMCREMDRMQEAGLPVYYIQGQHELDRVTPWMSVHPWPQYVHEQAFEVGGIKCWGLDWLPRGPLQEALQRVPPDTQLLMCHQVWEEFMGVGNTDGSLAEIMTVGTVLTGDYHKTVHQVVKGVDGGEMHVISPGSICMQSVDEDPAKMFVLINAARTTRFQQLLTRPFRSLLARTEEELVGACNEISDSLSRMTLFEENLPAEIRKPAFRVRYADNIPNAHNRLLQAIDSKAFAFLEPQPTLTDVEVDYEKGAQAGAFDGMASAIASLTPAGSLLGNYGLRLWNAQDVPAAIEELFQEFTTAPNG